MHRVVHFEIPADDTKRAVDFYKSVFDWDIDKWGDMEYYMCRTGKDAAGIDGAITDKKGTIKTTTNTIEVPSIEEYVAKIKKAGGAQVTEKDTIPEVGLFCYCRDTEGNVFGILQPIG